MLTLIFFHHILFPVTRKVAKGAVTVTPLLISLAVVVEIMLLVAAFGMGRQYQKNPGFGQIFAGSNTQTTPTNNMLQILSPQKGDVLCLDRAVYVRWKVPADMPAITLKIAEAQNGDTIHSIGSFASDYQGSSGTGVYSWNVGTNKDGVKIEPGSGYHILIQGTYKNYSLSNGSEYFTISDCTK